MEESKRNDLSWNKETVMPQKKQTSEYTKGICNRTDKEFLPNQKAKKAIVECPLQKMQNASQNSSNPLLYYNRAKLNGTFQ